MHLGHMRLRVPPEATLPCSGRSAQSSPNSTSASAAAAADVLVALIREADDRRPKVGSGRLAQAGQHIDVFLGDHDERRADRCASQARGEVGHRRFNGAAIQGEDALPHLGSHGVGVGFGDLAEHPKALELGDALVSRAADHHVDDLLADVGRRPRLRHVMPLVVGMDKPTTVHRERADQVGPISCDTCDVAGAPVVTDKSTGPSIASNSATSAW